MATKLATLVEALADCSADAPVKEVLLALKRKLDSEKAAKPRVIVTT